MTKKLTALFLTFCMMLSLLPVSAFAVSEGEASAPADSIVDTEENPNAAVDEDASDVDKDASDVDKDASDVDEDTSDVDEDASDVDEDTSDVDKDASDVDEDASDVDKDESGAAVPGDGNAAAAPDGEEKQQDEVTADLADMAEANTTTGNGFAERLDYSKFKSGATVVKNGSTEAQGFESPTGYFAVFVYEKKGDLVYLDSPITDENALKNYTGPYTGLYPIKTLGEIAHVYLKANNMLLFDPDTMKYGEILNQEKAIAPTEYTNTRVLYPAGGDGKINASDSGTSKINYFVEMNSLGEGKWGLAVPLPSGAFDYNYEIEDVNGHKATPIEINGTQKCDTAANGSTWMPDPNNPPMGNTVTGGQSRSSMVYIPYDAEYQAVAGAPTSGPYSVDRHVQIPLELNHEGITESDKGQVKADQYESQTLGGKRGIAVYLPKGYKDGKDYKVLYISHGAQSEYIGNEWRWMNEISAGNIMDNLIYEGKAEPFIIVAIDNKVMWNKEFTTNGGYEQMYHEIMKIVEHVEGNYKVAKGAENRAYAGLSMGAITGTWLMAKYPDEFSQFALWSGGYGAVNLTTETLAKVQEAAPEILLGCGDWDYVTVKATAEKLKQAGIAYEECYAPGSHDWNVWSLLLADAAENFFFQGKKDNDLNSYESGVTVEKDETSPTGYTATFIYEEPEKYLTTTGNEEVMGNIVKVELYSDCMMLFKPDEQTTPGAIDGTKGHKPSEFAPGMYPAGGNGNTTYYAEMTSLGNGRWGLQVPLSSGAFVYNFRLTDANGKQISRMDDPNNPTLKNTATGIRSLSSMVYVPYDAKQGTSIWADRSVEMKQADASKCGKVETIAYTGAEDTKIIANKQRGLAVYLPAGYDKNRSEPYNVLYLSHGASGDKVGNELRWMNEGAVANIMDNLVANGGIEPFVVVTMNNQDLGWDQNKIWAEQELIMKEIEARYNVSKEAKGRAFAGLSMGGITTSTIYLNHTNEFGYYGIWSAATDFQAKDALKTSNAKLMLAAGDWDFGLGGVNKFGEGLKGLGLKYQYLTVPAAHDWECWQLIYANAAKNFFFQGEKNDKLNSYESGVTVEKDETSPTGYTATFIYEEPEKYLTTTGNEEVMGNIVKVELYSDCMMLFKPDEQTTPGAIDGTKGHKPSEFAPGMYPAGGNGNTTYYAEMTSLGNGRWGLQVPLSSGAFVYNFRLTDANGKQISRMDDPNNPTLKNTATGIRSLSSMVYVPYDAKQGTSIWADRSVEMKQADASKCGKVETIAYTGAEDTKIIANKQRGLAVYLPAGYDKNRSEPYNVLYLSHGASGDKVGNELRWMNEGAVANIMDNLVANGGIEPFVVVTMNNQDLGWDQNKIWAEQELIMKEIEARYNVSKEAKGRAFAGLSMGGITTSTIYLNHTNEFGYYGIWSAATDFQAKDALKTSNAKLMLAAGDWDFGLGGVNKFGEGLKGLGLKYQYLTVPAAHDWECWQLIFANAAQNFFFKDSTGSKPSGPSGGSSGGSGGGSSSSYNRNVSVSSTRNGSVSFSPRNPAKGATVTLTVRPNSGYILDSIKVLDSKGVEIELTAKGNNQFTFTMPSGKITVDTQFASEGTSTPAPGFSDLSSDYWASAEISWAAEKGIMQGIRNGAFAPERTVTRQQLWMVMGRIDGSDPSDMAAACAWAKENSISDGTRPGDSLTRQQMVAILYRYAQLKGYSVTGSADTSSFPDHVNVSNYAKDAMAWAVGSGIVAGTSDGRLNPGGTATRAQFAVIMHRFCELYNMA